MYRSGGRAIGTQRLSGRRVQTERMQSGDTGRTTPTAPLRPPLATNNRRCARRLPSRGVSRSRFPSRGVSLPARPSSSSLRRSSPRGRLQKYFQNAVYSFHRLILHATYYTHCIISELTGTMPPAGRWSYRSSKLTHRPILPPLITS